MFFKRRSKVVELKKRTCVYVSDKHKHIVIASLSQNDAGIIYEQNTCRSVDLPVDVAELGALIINSFDEYSVKDANLRDHKASEWPAFKHSKSKSVKAFEQDYIRISIDGANEKNIILLFEGQPHKNSELTVNASTSYYADTDEIGQRLFSVYEACLTGKIF